MTDSLFRLPAPRCGDPQRARRGLRPLVVLLSMLCSAGCTVGPNFVRPAVPKLQHYNAQGEASVTVSAAGTAQRFVTGAEVTARWWRLFDSKSLDLAVQQALAGNFSLQAAQANLRQSEDNLRAGAGVFYPQIDLAGGATRQLYSPLRVGENLPGSIFNLYTLSASVGYALDVFGGHRREVEALGAQVDVQRYAALATYISLTGNIVNGVIASAAYRAQIRALQQIIAQQKEQIRLTRVQVKAGTAPYVNVLSLQSQLYGLEANLAATRQQRDQADHLLALLSGQAPAKLMLPAISLNDLKLPERIPRTLPSVLVRQRPDILQAEAQLHAANAQIGVATAALYPSFSLGATYGLNNTRSTDLFKSNSRFWSFGPEVALPVFHGGTLGYQRQAAIETYRQSLATYRQTVLQAFTQVADTLRALEHDAQALQAQAQALATARQALDITQANYEAGIAGYLQLIVANSQYLQARIAYISSTAQRLQDTVGLFVALGGGWWNAPDLPGGFAVPALRAPYRVQSASK